MEAYQKLEVQLAKWIGVGHVVSCNSGTSALTLALATLDIRDGDEVIIPNFTMVACAFACSYVGAVPVFVDCGDDLQIDVTKIEEAITPETRAIMAVHVYGRMCDMEAVIRIAKKHGLFVIEDCAEAHGAQSEFGRAGTIGDIGCFSTYRNKIISSQEGGFCTTNNRHLADRMKYLKNMAFDQDHSYVHNEIGFNFRMSNAIARLALLSLRRVEKELERRWKLFRFFDSFLSRFGFGIPSVPWVYPFLPGERYVPRILKQVPEARHFFAPMSMQPPYLGEYEETNAYYFYKNGVYISLTRDLTASRAKVIRKILIDIGKR